MERSVIRILVRDDAIPDFAALYPGYRIDGTETMPKKLKPKKLAPMRPGEVPARGVPGAAENVGRRFGQGPRLAANRIDRIASEQTRITADTALRLAKALGTTAKLWLNPQPDYDVQVAKRDLNKILDRIKTVNKQKAA
jgi:addiction module HigA family antidote